MVGEDHSLHPVLNGQPGVRDRLDPLDQDRTVPNRPEPANGVPRQTVVELGIHIARQVHSPTPVARTTLPVGQTLHVGEPDRLGA